MPDIEDFKELPYNPLHSSHRGVSYVKLKKGKQVEIEDLQNVGYRETSMYEQPGDGYCKKCGEVKPLYTFRKNGDRDEHLVILCSMDHIVEC